MNFVWQGHKCTGRSFLPFDKRLFESCLDFLIFSTLRLQIVLNSKSRCEGAYGFAKNASELFENLEANRLYTVSLSEIYELRAQQKLGALFSVFMFRQVNEVHAM
jgi:hypothetical protein